MVLFMGSAFRCSTSGINAGMAGLSRRGLWQQAGSPKLARSIHDFIGRVLKCPSLRAVPGSLKVLQSLGQLKAGLLGLRADAISVGACMDALQSSDLWSRALQAGSALEVQGLQFDLAVWNRICTSSSSMTSWSRAFVAVERLRGSFQPDAATDCCLAAACQAQGWSQSLGVLGRSRHRASAFQTTARFRLDAVLLPVVVLGACVKGGMWEAALALAGDQLGRLRHSSQLRAADVSLVEGQTKASQWEASIQLLAEGAWRGCRPALQIISAAGSTSRRLSRPPRTRSLSKGVHMQQTAFASQPDP